MYEESKTEVNPESWTQLKGSLQICALDLREPLKNLNCLRFVSHFLALCVTYVRYSQK